jgi:hypothetical protein
MDYGAGSGQRSLFVGLRCRGFSYKDLWPVSQFRSFTGFFGDKGRLKDNDAVNTMVSLFLRGLYGTFWRVLAPKAGFQSVGGL